MEDKKSKKITVEFLMPTSIERIQRWQICQNIGKVYYDSTVREDFLLALLETLRKYGISEK